MSRVFTVNGRDNGAELPSCSASHEPQIQDLDPRSLIIEGTQSRAAIDRATVREYADVYESGAALPALLVFSDGTNYYVADGCHRRNAAVLAELKTVPCEVQTGDLHQAQAEAARSNRQHGLRRTNADKRCAIRMALNNPLQADWSNSRIADWCGVGDKLVAEVRNELITQVRETETGTNTRVRIASSVSAGTPKRRVGRDGKTYAPTKPKTPRKQKLPYSDARLHLGRLIRELDNLQHFDRYRDDLAPLVHRFHVLDFGETIPTEDPIGQPIPPHLASIFAVTAEVDAQLRRLASIQQWVKDMKFEVKGAWMDVGCFNAGIEAAVRVLTASIPHVCPYCQANVSSCSHCRSLGFVNKQIYDEAPHELRM